MIDAARYGAAPPETVSQVASGFFNDLFWFDQMACSSPQVVFWLGAPDVASSAAAKFEQALQAEVARRKFAPPVSSAVHRRAYAFGVAASTDVRVVLEYPGFVGVHLRDPALLSKEVCGGGLVRHVPAERLADVLASSPRETRPLPTGASMTTRSARLPSARGSEDSTGWYRWGSSRVRHDLGWLRSPRRHGSARARPADDGGLHEVIVA
jgi:Acyl-CoA reductase (LuxC).